MDRSELLFQLSDFVENSTLLNKDKILDYLKKSTNQQKYSATGLVNGYLIKMTAQVQLNNYPYIFKGTAKGFVIPGFGKLIGDVYTDNLDILLERTNHFGYICAGPYATIIFYKDNLPLGNFESFSISTVTGGADGSGEWKKIT